MDIDLDALLRIGRVSVSLEPFMTELEPSVWVEVPEGRSIDETDEVLDFLVSKLDVMAFDAEGWSAHTEKRGERRGRAYLELPRSSAEQAVEELRTRFAFLTNRTPTEA